jgi:nitrogen fixation protein FixH
VDKPYEAGLAWDQGRRDLAELGWRVRLEPAAYRVGDNELRLFLSDRNGAPLGGALVSLNLKRPSTTAYDRSYRASEGEAGSYAAGASLPLPGAWDLLIEVSQGGRSAILAERIEAERKEP